jgi:hypothetical protein
MRSKVDRSWFGFLAGILLPPLTFLVIFLFLGEPGSFGAYLEKVVGAGVLTKFLSLAVIPNLLLFFIFIWQEHLKAARGTLAATFVSAFLVLLIKILV